MAMADTARVICASAALTERGKGVRFSVLRAGKPVGAFAVRYNGCAYAYLNHCAHIPVELDWVEGEFFDYSGLYLICTTHGATYEPDTGYCIMGPCKGRRLSALDISEHDGRVFLTNPTNSENHHG
jgi:nitrite reductase/ring-hydroxylating ferredoxin subunit